MLNLPSDITFGVRRAAYSRRLHPVARGAIAQVQPPARHSEAEAEQSGATTY